MGLPPTLCLVGRCAIPTASGGVLSVLIERRRSAASLSDISANAKRVSLLSQGILTKNSYVAVPAATAKKMQAAVANSAI